MVANGSDIQPENGFVRIHPAILELLASAELSAYELRCVLFLLRKTYGWGKREDVLSYQQFADGTGIPRRSVIRSINSLVEKKVITVSERKIGRAGHNIFRFNKYFEQWIGVVNGVCSDTISGTNGVCSDTISSSNGNGNSVTNDTIKTEIVSPATLEIVSPVTPTIDKKETNTAARSEPLPEQSAPNPEAEKYGKFVRMWEQVHAALINPSIAGFIDEWVNAVTETEWIYALGESMAKKNRWDKAYVAGILRRIASERLSPLTPPVVGPVIVSVPSIPTMYGD